MESAHRYIGIKEVQFLLVLKGIIPLFILAVLNWKIFSAVKKLKSSLRSDSPVNNRLVINPYELIQPNEIILEKYTYQQFQSCHRSSNESKKAIKINIHKIKA